ncbi:MAG: HlyD family efflux transporter periplasmic adaptor subunit [Candidatus Zixiibacteriota bacterium]
MCPLATTDRLIDPAVLSRRRWKSITRVVAILLVVAIACYVLYTRIRPSVSRTVIRTSVADIGTVEASIPATGIILPAHEQVITSPIDSRVIAVLRHVGDKLAPGDQILLLDTSEAHLALERTTDNLTLKENELAQVDLELQNERSDLASHREIKKLQADLLASKADQLRKLYTLGGASGEQVGQAELEQRVAAIELVQLETSFQNRELVAKSKLANLETEIGLLRKEQAERQRLLHAASTRVDQAGVLTWVIGQEGAAIRKSDQIARISDLASFHVQGTASDVHAGKLTIGLPARVIVNDSALNGIVTAVNPSIQSGVMTFEVALADPTDARLHPNLKADVYIVAAQKQSVLRIRRGQTGELTTHQFVFVKRDGVAVKIDVQFGLVGYDYIEIISGLHPGDTVLISDMREYEHLEAVRID